MTLTDLDSLFDYLYKKGTVYTPYREIVAEHFKNDEQSFDIEGMLIKLDKDGYVDTGTYESNNNFGWRKQTTYKLSFEGRFLYENSVGNKPYLALKRKERQRQVWVIVKTVMAALNAIAILYLMWRAIPQK